MAMDIKTLLNNLHEEVSCSVCMNTFTNPKTLSCLHSFCLHCLMGIQRTSGRHDMITCPECRRESTISSGNLDALPTNFRINSLLDVLAIKQCDFTEAKCGNCDKKSSHSFYCFKCFAFWCEDCITLHNGMRANKEHRVLALKDFQEEDFADILKRPAFCQKQGHEKKELEFFCKRCEEAICSSCVATIHDGHAKILLEEAANECKLRLKGFLESQKKSIQQKKNDIAKIDENCHKIHAEVGNVKRDVQAFSDKIIAAVIAKKEEIFIEVENQAKETLQRQGIQKSEIEQQLKTINASVGRTETVLKRNSSAELIQCNKSLNNFFQEEVDRENQLGRASESVPEFVYFENEKILNTVLNEGIGFVENVSKRAAPHQSNAEGNGIRNATVGLKAQFVLTTRTADGRQCYNERDEVTLEINNQQRQDCMAQVQIEDRKDGTYNICYFVSEAGKLNASVKVNGDHVRGSPFGVRVKDREYKPVLSFGQQGSSAGTVGASLAVAVNNRDEIAVTEAENNRVHVFRSDGTYLRCFGGPGQGKGEFEFPMGIAFDQNGNILVSDSGNNRVQIFDEQGNYLDAFDGAEGSLDSGLDEPADLNIDSDGNIIVADVGNKVVKVFSNRKQILQKIGEDDVFKFPCSCVSYKQYLIVSDEEEHRVNVFDGEQGIFLCKFTSVGDADGQFNGPTFLAVDKAGHLMVCDTGNHRIQVFKLNGEFVAKFGTVGKELGEFDSPSGIAVLSDGRIVVSDRENHRIQIFE